MAKLHTTELEQAQAKYATQFGQEKLDKLPAKYSKDATRLLSKVNNEDTDSTTVETTPTQGLTAEHLQMIKDLQDEVSKLKSKDEKKDPKAMYEGPSFYSYKLWNGKPVLGYTSKKLNTNYGFTHKNALGQVISNQALSLVLYNLETQSIEEGTEIVEVNQFNLHFERSEKMKAAKTNVGSKVGYTFSLNGQEFTVLESVIN